MIFGALQLLKPFRVAAAIAMRSAAAILFQLATARTAVAFLTSLPSAVIPSPAVIRRSRFLVARAKNMNTQDAQIYAEFLELKDRRQALQECFAFGAVDVLDVERLIQVMEKIPIEKDTNVFSQGDDKADAMYFVASGAFECFDESTGTVQCTLGRKDSFGELALLTNEPRALSVRAASADSSVWRLLGKDFAKVMLMSGDTKQKAIDALADQAEYADFLDMKSCRKALRSCPIFQNLSPNDLDAIVDSMEKVYEEKGNKILEQGGEGDSMYFVADGTLSAIEKRMRRY